MSTIKNLGVLAFASTALAIPHAHWQPFKRQGHDHWHSHSWSDTPSDYSAAPSGSSVGAVSAPSSGISYPAGNTTTVYGSTGTAGATTTGGWTSVGTDTEISTSTAYSTNYITNYVSPVPTTYGNAASSSEECSASDVTVTTTEHTTVYITAGESSSEVSAVGASSSSYVAPASSSAQVSAESYGEKAPSHHHHHSHTSSEESSSSSVYVPPSSSSVYVAPTTSSYAAPSSYSAPSSSPAAPASSSEAPSSSYVAPSSSYVAPSSSAAAPATTSAASSYSSSSAAPSSSSSSGGGGKRGLAYNDASLCDSFLGNSNFGYAYNWASDSSGLSSSSVQYIPMLWGPTSDFTPSWSSNAQSAIDNGAEYLFSFNEPDMPSEANLTPEEAASAWKQYMEPFAGKAKLCAPSVTNGQGTNPLMGLDWLSAFLDACSDCTIDCVNQHWYDTTSNDAGYFKTQVWNATNISGGKPVFVSEFGAIGSDSDISTFLEDVMPWMDSQDSVLSYFYFMVSDGLLVNGNSPSSYGETYLNYN